MRINLDGKEVEAEPVEFEVAEEPWQVLRLKDREGTLLRLKLVVTDVFRTDQKTEAGDTIYVVKTSTIVAPRRGERERKEDPSS
jgi:hypothetical protein